MIDFAGPWEVFQDVIVPSRTEDAPVFRLYTVSTTTDPITVSGGMKLIPDYTLESAPQPKVIVIPAQSGQSEAMLQWIRKSSEAADVTMSVCTGAFLLAKTGLLKGKPATTHHGSYGKFAMQYPDVQLKRGLRFVEGEKIATAGGLTSGIDLALRVVERYYGRDTAERTAVHMEYQGQGWLDSSGAANAIYAKTPAGLTDPACGMLIDSKTPHKSEYKGTTYYFCTAKCKNDFDAAPEHFVEAASK